MLDDLMEYLNPTALVLTLIGYAICMLALWKFNMGNWVGLSRIIISVLALPILYAVVSYQLSR